MRALSPRIAEGEIVKSKVLRITDQAVILDVGFKSEGSVPLDEFKDVPKEGDEVEVFLEHLEDQDGAVVLSKKKADFMRVWEKIREPTRRTSRSRACWSRRSRAVSSCR
jgi:small subunit ribosomal protein S1